jgi:hypothetical protein
LGFRMGGVGLEDEHFDRFAAHDGLLCWEAGAEESSFGDLDVRFVERSAGSVYFAEARPD